jgi:hypothetical protein
MFRNPKAYRALPVGIVLRRAPGVTRWQRYAWRASAVLPGAGPSDWREILREGDVVEYHAATVTLELHGAEAEAYDHNLCAQVPCVYVVMRASHDDSRPFEIVLATASPYEAQDYTDSGEEVVEKVAMPPELRALVADFVAEFLEADPFVKRKRDRKRVDLVQDGIGDPRIGKPADIYASPGLLRRRVH